MGEPPTIKNKNDAKASFQVTVGVGGLYHPSMGEPPTKKPF
jgi:hypothetical protein